MVIDLGTGKAPVLLTTTDYAGSTQLAEQPKRPTLCCVSFGPTTGFITQGAQPAS